MSKLQGNEKVRDGRMIKEKGGGGCLGEPPRFFSRAARRLSENGRVRDKGACYDGDRGGGQVEVDRALDAIVSEGEWPSEGNYAPTEMGEDARPPAHADAARIHSRSHYSKEQDASSTGWKGEGCGCTVRKIKTVQFSQLLPPPFHPPPPPTPTEFAGYALGRFLHTVLPLYNEYALGRFLQTVLPLYN